MLFFLPFWIAASFLGLFLLLVSWLLLRRFLVGPDLSRYDRPPIMRATQREEPSPQVEQVHELLRRLRSGDSGRLLSPQRVQRVRALFDEGFGGQEREPAALGVEIRPVEDGAVPGEWVLHRGSLPDRRLLYLHGGAFYVGSPRSHRPLTAQLSRRLRAAVFAADYRLMPENTRHDGIVDAQEAYRYLIDSGPEGPAPARTLFVAGDSAGGNLALMVIAWAKSQGLRSADAAIALSPATDGTLSSPTLRENYRTDVMLGPLMGPLLLWPRTLVLLAMMIGTRMHPRNPLVSPLHGDLSGLPPVLVQASESEMLLGDARRWVNKARSQGSPAALETWPGMVHVWQIFDTLLPEADEALGSVERFVEQATGAGSRGDSG